MPPGPRIQAWRSTVARLRPAGCCRWAPGAAGCWTGAPIPVSRTRRLEVSPWPAPMDHLSLVEAVDGFGESVVIGISDAADRRLHASFSQALGLPLSLWCTSTP